MAGCTSPWVTWSGAGSQRRQITVPCKRCISCLMRASKDWGTRIMHERAFHERACFVTLTFSDEHLPDPPSLAKRHVQLFMKRLRFETGVQGIKYFACGEYGGKTKRPHYHLILLGVDFREDRYSWRVKNGHEYFRSPFLETLWPYGNAEFSDVTPESAAYAAGYALKKAHGFSASGGDPYTRLNAQTGEFYQVEPEFVLFSKGLGFRWLERFGADAYPSGFVVLNGAKRPVPRAYTAKLRRDIAALADGAIHPLGAAVDAYLDQGAALAAERETDDSRLAVLDKVSRIRGDRLKRDLE